jgi:cell wall-associated NlpC family hydrolase
VIVFVEDDYLRNTITRIRSAFQSAAITTAALLPTIIATSLVLAPNYASARTYHSYRAHSAKPQTVALATRSSLDRSARALMSRSGGYDTPAQRAITGQVGEVTSGSASIYAGREDYGRLLSSVSKGDQIVVTGQTDTYYAVAMSNHTIGFIAKSNVQLMSWQVTTSGVTDTSGDASTYTSQSQMDCPLADNILQAAMNYKGVTPYVWGGNTMQGIDCSGFVKAVYAQNGITLPRTAADQAKIGYAVPLTDSTQWMPGDRVYFQCHHDYIDHTGMYMGNGFFIHSSINHHGVDIDKIAEPYYWQHLVAVRRSAEMVQALQTATSTGQTIAKAGTPDMESTEE